jgi:hypothetical protein
VGSLHTKMARSSCPEIWQKWASPEGCQQNGSNVYIAIQCKRYDKKKLTKRGIEADVTKADSFLDPISEYLITTTESRDTTIQDIIRDLNDKRKLDNKFTVQVVFWDDICSNLAHPNNYDLLKKYYSEWERIFANNQQQIDKADEIDRNLKLRDTLKRELRKPPTQRRSGKILHPYEQFRYSRIIIRSLEDSDYPNTNISDSSGISSWFRVNLYNFYHNGIEVILYGGYAIINEKGEWRPIDYSESFDECIFNRIEVWVIGCLPYKFIKTYDLDGDEHYNEPHLYCSFANNGEPYETIHYRTVGGDRDYDWPLEEDRRLPAVATV